MRLHAKTVIILIAATLASVYLCPLHAEDAPGRTIILLNSYHPGFSWSDQEATGVTLRLGEKYPLMDIPVEYIDAKRYPGKGNLARMKDILIEKYKEKKIDLIISLDDPALEMLVEYKEELFSDIPIIFAGINNFDPYAVGERGEITGILEVQDITHTINTALMLNSDIRRIVAISDTTISGISARKAMESVMSQFAGRVKIDFLPACTFEEAKSEVASLQKDTAILLNTYTTDNSGRILSTKESTHLIVSASKVPVYGVHQNRFGDGIIGGYLLSGREHGRKAADIAIRILDGENTDSIPIDRTGSSIPMFDYGQMNRFNLPLSRLPEGSIVINRPESIFVSHRKFALTITIILIILVVALTLLLLFTIRLIQARAALREKSDELDRIFNLSLDLFCIAGFNGRFIRLNPAWEKTIGYSIDELEGRMFTDFVHPDDIEATGNVLSELAAGRDIIDFTNRYMCRDGSWRWIEWRATPYQGTIIYAAARDTTERKTMEQSLREREGFLRTLLQTIPDMIWLKNPDGIFLACNKMFGRFIGADEENMIGRTDYDFVENDLADFFRENDLRAIDAGKPLSNEEWVTFADDGHRALLETIKTPMVDDRGNLIGVLGIARDITARKIAEEEQTRLKDQLLHVQKMESVGRLAGGVAHDFNNMLSVIIGYTEMALEQSDPSFRFHTELKEIMKAALRSADITRQLLAFARKQTVSPKILDINETVAGMTLMLKRLIGEDIDLIWRPGKSVWPVRIDPGQVDQILANLCINARDAIEESGKITIETSNIEMDEEYCAIHHGFQHGEYVLLAVSDNGNGMDTETINNIFEPFFTTKIAGKGTGLGLATVYGIVKQNNGFINVYSEPEQGTTFKLYIPRYIMDSEIVHEEKVDMKSVEGGSERILMVEDDPSIIKMTGMMLESLGYEIIAAHSPAEAIDIAMQDHNIDLLLTDVIMPGMNGRTLAGKIEAILPGLRVLFMSGYTADVIAHHGVLEEGVNFIQKPFSKTTLATKIREALGDGRLNQ